MKLNRISLLFSVVLAVYSTFSGTAFALGKTITIDAADGGSTFKLSTSEPLEGNESSLNLKLGLALLELVSEEQLQNVRAEFSILLADGSLLKREFLIGATFPQEEVISIGDLIFSISANLRIDNSNQLVIPRTIEPTYDFRAVVAECRDIRVVQSTSHPEVRRLIMRKGIARMVGLMEVVTGRTMSDTKIFTANVYNFPGAKVEVIGENGKLVLKRNDREGNLYDAYVFDQACSF